MITVVPKNSVLIVDDESSNIIALTNILTPEYTVYAASDGQDGIDAALEHLPDVILLDIIMPDMNGYEMFSRLKNTETAKDIPVIFITGLANAQSEEMGLALGAVDYITKPFNPEIVKLRIQHQVQMINQLRMIKHLNATDQLTEVPNKRSFNDRLRLDWDYARRQQSPLGILFIDVDDFKKYNDTCGHINGDLALQVLAKLIKQTLARATDFVARWGGEEFVVLLPDTDLAGAALIAECIRNKIENAPIPCTNGDVMELTVSIGVNAHTPVQGSSIDEFVTGADDALYVAKNTGKNTVCKFEKGCGL